MILKHLRPQLLSIVCASLLSVLLGGVSALLALSIGPAMQLFLAAADAPDQAVSSLVGEHLAALFAYFTGVDVVSRAWLLQIVPVTLLGLAVVRATLSIGQWFIWERAGELMSRRWRQALLRGYVYQRPDARHHDLGQQWESELASLLTNDIRVVREYVIRVYGALPRELCQVTFLVANLLLLSPKMFLLFAFALGPALVLASRLGKKLRRRAAAALKDYSQLSEWIQQRLLGIETIKQYQTELVEAAAMRQLNDGLLRRFLKVLRVKSLSSPVLEACAVVAMAIVLAVMLSDVLAGSTTGSVQFAFFSTLALLGQAADRCGRYLNANREGRAALERLRALEGYLQPAQLPALDPWVGCEGPKQLSMAIENLSVRYDGRAVDALSNVSAEFVEGRFYCVCGPSGAGKSTLMKVMLGLVRPNAGQLRLAGPHAKQAVVGYLPQQFQLMNESIAANIAYPDPLPDEARVRAMLQKVGMDDFVATLPNQLSEVVGPGGRALSGGQMQKLQVARVMYHDYPVIMIDEGTSALDPQSEQQMLALVRVLTQQKRIVIMIAHRPAVAVSADHILLFDRGQLVTQGPAPQVMQSPEYMRLVGLT